MVNNSIVPRTKNVFLQCEHIVLFGVPVS